MPYKNKFFRKIVVLVFMLLLPVIVIYSYSYQVNVSVVKSEIENSSMGNLRFFLSQVENNVAQLALHSVTLTNDSSIREMMRLDKMDTISSGIEAKKRIMEKLILYSTSSPWQNNMSVYSPLSGAVLTTYPLSRYEMRDIKIDKVTRWSYGGKDDTQPDDRFTWYTIDPPAARNDPSSANLIVEVSFSVENIKMMLDQYMTSKQGNPFFYAPGLEPIIGHKGSVEKVRELTQYLNSMNLKEQVNHEPVKISGENYMLSYVPSATLGWYLVDFVPLEKAIAPINKNRNAFYTVISILLILGIAVSFVIYRNVQIPILQLMNNVQKLKRGDYSARLLKMPKNEFFFLFNRFNEMAGQIQELIENVYWEKIRSREAIVKQLQSQINPHFFYNCLFFIVSMSRLGDQKAVEAMATNLGDYYRYTTRTENQTTTLADELGLVRNYLTIQQLRQQIEYEIQVPEFMQSFPFSRLLLQPLIENAIIHGIERKKNVGRIVIRGELQEKAARLIVEDNGKGMTDAEMQELDKKLRQPLTEEMGCGLWNVNQRLIHIFGSESGLALSHSELGGVKAALCWRKDDNDNV
ncbi:sensor histidine kinase [Paenibacillus piri]|nr:histidine kinase [Paenibacillus piri]